MLLYKKRGSLLLLVLLLTVSLMRECNAENTMLECELDLFQMFHPKTVEQIEMFDYTGKAVDDMGNYDGCRHLDESTAHYCVAQTMLHVSMANEDLPAYLGICAPASCNSTMLTSLMKKVLVIPPYNLSTRYSLDEEYNTLNVHCTSGKEKDLSAGAIITIIIMIILVLLVGLGTYFEMAEPAPPRPLVTRGGDPAAIEEARNTLLDAKILDEANGPSVIDPNLGNINGSMKISSPKQRNFSLPLSDRKRSSKVVDILKCFGLIANIKSLFQDNRPLDPSLACLNGLRVIMICWVILGHTFGYMAAPIGYDNLMTIKDMVGRVSFQVIPSAELAVDAFFYLSGFLVVYMVLKEMKQKNGRMPWALFYFHRYWRLTPVYAFIILVYTTVSPYLIEGPFEYQYRQLKTDQCDSYWWTNMLYINNFYPKSSMQQCLGWSWYLANDMQFYIFSPVIIIAFFKNKRAGWMVVSVLLAICMILNAVLGYHYELNPLDANNNTYNSIIYNKPYTRMAPYIVGIIFAFLMQEETLDLARHRLIRYITYLLSFTITTCTTYLTYGFWRHGWNLLQDVTYMTFARTGFALAIGWIMYCCHKGHGGILRQILSLYMWIPLARLTYTVYLLHPMIIFVINFSTTTTFHYSAYYGAVRYSCHLMIAYVLGAVFYLTVEKPTANLEKVFLPARRRH